MTTQPTEYVRIVPTSLEVTLEAAHGNKLALGLAIDDNQIDGHWLITLTAEKIGALYESLTRLLNLTDTQTADLIQHVHERNQHHD